MTDWMPCIYALALIAGGISTAGVVGFWLGRWREQLALLQTLRPET